MNFHRGSYASLLPAALSAVVVAGCSANNAAQTLPPVPSNNSTTAFRNVAVGSLYVAGEKHSKVYVYAPGTSIPDDDLPSALVIAPPGVR
jgi:hypothetical protein